jgi:hypothetical protein
MKYFFRCVSTEILKTKRTIYLAGVIVLPAILSLFNFILLFGLSTNHDYDRKGGWVHFEHNTITFWALLVFPCVIILLSAFNAHQEHDTRQWRRLMCLPLPGASLYLAKLTVVMGLAFLSCLVVWVDNIIFGWAFSTLQPEKGLSMAQIELWDMLVPFLWIFLLSLLILAIHYWFSMRVQNFVLSIGIGFALVLVGAFLHENLIFNRFFPWSIPSLVYRAESFEQVLASLALDLVGFVIIIYAGCRNFIRQDVLS